MIPKTIYYVWFGQSEKSAHLLHYLATWKKFAPDFNIVEINDRNFLFNKCPIVKALILEGKFAFAADIAKLYMVYQHGGIGMDIDVEMIKPLPDLLGDSQVLLTLESAGVINTPQFFAAEKEHIFIDELLRSMLKEYDNGASFVHLPKLGSKMLLAKGMSKRNVYQVVQGITILPSTYIVSNRFLGSEQVVDNTFAIHHLEGSWVKQSLIHRLRKNLSLIKRTYLEWWRNK
ncbi:hypothetical protein H9L19_02040 [Weissella diestrammenae]|uniref:Glycosyl transferase n=1 Tax=Weissella diestrammenae TaxID=1162633 RepID=A0A7G9T6F3_9LACO|nr:glycosyltransferase [Weissella diestrammenae]MCM0583275.1 hypothetical protein [Weissella diestrammenae]QNN75678.1 hypothetical protein H9L19_02040 [Weissella diestrammenae]